ncbi:MAG: hypothetical protein NDI61_01175 [Bdellovibrionaceae bacterium]|nr:hypothetical protein [Pseudobdellovibrionaceae bacterium]
MLLKRKQNRVFGTFDLIGVLALGGAVLAICSTIVFEILQDDSHARARFGAEALAHQLMAGGFGPEETSLDFDSYQAEAAERRGARGPASVLGSAGASAALTLVEGIMGKDPWGRPFHYKVLRAHGGLPVRILVWSDGPNAASESELADFEVAQLSPSEQVQFQGDDVGYLYVRP